MDDKPKNPNLLGSIRHLLEGGTGERRRVARTEPDPRLSQLRQWQASRLSNTYADLLDSPQYGPACRFFLEDIYSDRDFSQRDHDAEHIYQVMRRFLPLGMLETLSTALHLNELTAELDQALIDVLVDELGLTDEITVPLYAEAYRRCDNFEERSRQIDLIVEVGTGVNRLVSFPLVGMVLRLARGPARQAGWSELQNFLERGFSAFKQLDDADQFLHIIESRERSILDRIYQGDPEPFAVQSSPADA